MRAKLIHGNVEISAEDKQDELYISDFFYGLQPEEVFMPILTIKPPNTPMILLKRISIKEAGDE
jgi:hypothetical protein